MTIADKLTRLSTAHDAIISAINAKGGSATGDGFEDFAADIAAIPSGGGSSYTLLASAEMSANTTSTSATVLGTIAAGSSAWTADDILYVRIRDKAGKRNGYFYGGDAWVTNINAANGVTTDISAIPKIAYSYNSSTWYQAFQATASGYGVYLAKVASDGSITISTRYSSSSSRTINGTYKVEVYKLSWANDEHPFA